MKFSLSSLAVSVAAAILLLSCQPEVQESKYPLRIADDELVIDLIAEQPTIVTPIGLAIDQNDDLLVLESHTHSPPSAYSGPAFDRIKKGIDKDQDGIPEDWLIFADSIEDGMNLSLDQHDAVYLAYKNGVDVYRDTDGDGRSDKRTTLLKMIKPDNVYDHAGILGVAVGPDEWVYISRGNTGGRHWVIESMAGEQIEGFGDGGNVFRCRTDGTQLEQVATGFWNPFDIKFTASGRLMVTDNDPDSRGPNRLLEIVPGGDYGYQSLYGGSGVHPYLAWNGELPGTLPFAAPLGEAPCAFLDATFTNFGATYQGQILANIWEENNIVRIPLQPRGSTVTGSPEVLVQGDSTFHPVALVANSRGELYITDWVVREYPNHGHGKIWRLSSRDKGRNALPAKEEMVNRFESPSVDWNETLRLLKTGDAFDKAIVRHHLPKDSLLQMLQRSDASVKLQALLALLKTDITIDRSLLATLLLDENEAIRRMSMIYIGKHFRTDLLDHMQQALVQKKINADLFDTYLATVEHLQPIFMEHYQAKDAGFYGKLPTKLPESFLESIIRNAVIPESVRALAIPYLENLSEQKTLVVEALASARDTSLQLALLKAAGRIPSQQMAQTILGLIQNEAAQVAVRTQAVLALGFQPGSYCADVQGLLSSAPPLLQAGLLRYLCRCRAEEDVQKLVSEQINATSDDKLKAIWALCTGAADNRPNSPQAWKAKVHDTGNPQQGRLVFESAGAQCQTCHKVSGWGGNYGPELSKVGSSKSREQLIDAILTPSKEIAPDWQGWFVVDQEGNSHYGRQIDVHLHKVELMNQSGDFDSYSKPRKFGVMETSLMPEGLQNNLTVSEFNDLIAYLQALK